MKTIYKFRLNQTKECNLIDIPRGFYVLKVGYQGEDICVWVEVESSNELVQVPFCSVPTGGLIQEHTPTYAGTVFDGPFVWHVYHGYKV